MPIAERQVNGIRTIPQRATQLRKHLRPLLFVGVVMTALVLGIAELAVGHGGSGQNYPCSDKIAVDHSQGGGYHNGSVVPLGVNPPTPCTYYQAQSTTTSWSGGGGSGWYTHPNNAVTSTWQTSWWNAIARNSKYCYIVRTGGRGRVGESTTYSWRFNTHGGGISSC